MLVYSHGVDYTKVSRHFLDQCSLDGRHSGQLTLRKNNKIGATRCQILTLKWTRPLAVFKGLTSKGREGGERGPIGQGGSLGWASSTHFTFRCKHWLLLTYHASAGALSGVTMVWLLYLVMRAKQFLRVLVINFNASTCHLLTLCVCLMVPS